MAKLEIIGVPQSSYTRAVCIACDEKGVDYQLTMAGPHTPPVDAVHPFGKVPVMRHGDFELCESRAIVAYLDRAFPGPKLIPDDARQAAVAEQWISMFNTVMDRTLIRDYVLGYIFPKGADGKPDRQAIEALKPQLKAMVDLLDKAVAKSGYLAGDHYTFADMNVMPALYWLQHFPEGIEAMAGAKNLKAYYDRNAARPSFAKTMPSTPAEDRARAS